MDLIQDSYQIPDSSQKTSSILIRLRFQYVIPRKNRFFSQAAFSKSFSGATVAAILLIIHLQFFYADNPFELCIRDQRRQQHLGFLSPNLLILKHLQICDSPAQGNRISITFRLLTL